MRGPPGRRSFDRPMESDHHVVIVGAGIAGIASALALKDAGLSPVVLDRADRVASAWRSRYDSLRLNTWRRFSCPAVPTRRERRPFRAATRWWSTSNVTPPRTGWSSASARASSGSSNATMAGSSIQCG